MSEARQIMTAHEDTAAREGLPGTLPGALARSRVELRSFFRNWQSLVFTMALPVLMLLVFGAVFTGKLPGTDTDYRLLFVSGIIAAGVMSTSFQSLAISVSLDRENGLIRRLAASPMPKAAYFIGITVKTIVTTLIETAVLVVLGVVLYGLPMPSDAGRWLTFAWVVLLGVTSCSLAGIAYTALIPNARSAACSLAGIAYTALIPNARSAAAIATPPFMILQFISGVFFPLMMIPAVLRYTASAFPLLWMAKGLRFVFLPDSLASAEPGGDWNLGLVCGALVAWTVGGVILVVLTFRWRGRRVK